MPKTHITKLPDLNVWIRIRIQMGIFFLGYLCILLKASYWGSVLGPRIFLWPCFLFYLSIFATPITSVFLVLILGLIHDSVFDMPLGLSSFIWVSWHWFLAKERRYFVKSNTMVLWGAFAATLCIASGIECFVLTKAHRSVNVCQAFIETIFHIGFFPFGLHLFHFLLIKLGKFK